MATTTRAATVTPELVTELLRPGEVALSADGKRIAAAVSASFREKGKPMEVRLWVGDVDGELQPGELGAVPRFSPDGSRLAYASDHGHDGRRTLWIADSELGPIPGSVEHIAWRRQRRPLLVPAVGVAA